MPGNKTHDHQVRQFEKGGTSQDDRAEASAPRPRGGGTEVFRTGDPPTHRETRDHNKHNDPRQQGHKPQRPTPEQEKH